jgi:hypothetical protein
MLDDFRITRLALGAAALAVLTGFAQSAMAPASLPFGPGESLAYRVSAGRLGRVGRGVLRVAGPERMDDQSVLLLSFDVRTRIGFAVGVDSTRSWLDPQRMESLRFYKRERNPLTKSLQDVRIFPAQRRWQAADGEAGSTSTDAPLDELSFLYFIRTLPLRPGDAYEFDRHFQAGRNPVDVRVLRREPLTVPAGTFQTIAVEMRVKDPQHYGGEGVILVWLSDDDARLPVRIESAVPVLGRAVLSLEAHSPGAP